MITNKPFQEFYQFLSYSLVHMMINMNCFYHKQANDNPYPQEQIEQLHEHFKGIALH